MIKKIDKDIAYIDKNVIKIKVKEILAEILGNIDVKKVKINSTFDELGIDSFEGVLILVAIEQKFNITIDRNESSKLRTFGEILRLIEKHMKKKVK